jgi:excisionase family DNA binding protein
VAELMSTREVADYLRIKERKVYDLVRLGRIPCTRITGKLLFRKTLIDDWLAGSTLLPPPAAEARAVIAPPVVAGSHDPLLEWALRESECGLALMAGGSLDGLRRLAQGQAVIAAMHVLDRQSGQYNVPLVRETLPEGDVVVLEWAWRDQGLIVPPGNPLGLQGITDLASARVRVARRQDEAGSQILLARLMADAGMDLDRLTLLSHPARSETDLALAVLEGKADAGLAVAAVARQFRLGFLLLHRERFDLVLRRRDYFEPEAQALFAFARSKALAERAAELTGYDLTGLGRVQYNGP